MDRMLARTFIALLCVTLTATASAQITTGVVSGALKDEQGGVVPGATVTLISETRGTRVGNADQRKRRLRVSERHRRHLHRGGDARGLQDAGRAGSRQPRRPRRRAALTLEVGRLDETVDVKAEAAVIQAASGERSFTVTTESVEQPADRQPQFSGFATLVPGVIGSRRIAGGVGSWRRRQNNIMMDGVSTMDTGNNGH